MEATSPHQGWKFPVGKPLKRVRWHPVTFSEALTMMNARAQRAGRWCNVCSRLCAQWTALGNWALGSPDSTFWQSALDAWPWTQPYGMFQATPAPRALSNFICAVCHWHSGAWHSFKPWFPDLAKQNSWQFPGALHCPAMKPGSGEIVNWGISLGLVAFTQWHLTRTACPAQMHRNMGMGRKWKSPEKFATCA